MTEFSYQLYSSRNFPPVEATLTMLAKAGYTGVEGYGGVYDDLAMMAAALKRHDLSMKTGHFSLDMLLHQVSHVLTIAETLGMERLYCPHLAQEDRPDTAAGWHDFGAALQAAGKPYREAGFGFGWHNHDFELEPLEDGGLPLDCIFAGGPDLEWEADIAWLIRGGADPFDWIARHGTRLTAAHIKDIAPGQPFVEDGWADVGHGTVDWRGLIKALGASHCKHFVMEHDNPSDDVRFAKRTIAAAKGF